MIKSLRLKLLAWYAVILLGLAGVFGGLLYTNLRRSIEGDIDAELRVHAAAVAGVVVPVDDDSFYVELSREQVAHFRTDGAGASHYAIWTADGGLIDSSHPELSVPFPRSRGSRDRSQFRELIVRGPADTWILVGKDVRRERQQLHRHGAIAAAVGVVAIFLMLAGGWFLTGRALAPIERISRAASAISVSNLSERIEVSRMETELAGLAGTINQAFDRLEQAFEQQTRFTADASHELRTPLSIILSHAELALKRERGESEYRDALATVRRAAYRMKGVVEGLLTLARADAGGIQLRTEHLDLRQLVEETSGMLQPLADEKRITIVQRLESISIMGDRGRLLEAIANLLTNAIQHNGDGGRVYVSLRGNDAQAELRVADNGPGIPVEEQPHIFERFYRVDESRSQVFEGGSQAVGGSGLGLAITKWIIDSHNGSIACAAGEEGGTVFIVRLPFTRN